MAGDVLFLVPNPSRKIYGKFISRAPLESIFLATSVFSSRIFLQQANILMKIQRRAFAFPVLAALFMTGAIWLGSLSSCATLNALAGLSKLQFKLMDCNNVSLAGINVMNKHSVSDFSISDGINLMGAFSSGRFPLTMTVNVAAKNPNPATSGGIGNTLTLAQFPWRLLVDQHQTVTGGIGAPLSIPGGGTTETIPLQVSIDVKQFFADKSYNDILTLATSLSGQGGSSHLQLMAQPTIGTPLGNVKYPNELSIVNTQFTAPN
jgi:hypothetical protein